MKRSTFITWDQLKVGVVILAAIAVLTVAVFKLGQAANLFASRYELVTFLPNANGLRVGGSVGLAGQPVGTVKDIQFLDVDADTTRNLRIIIEIDEALRDQVREDSRARLRTMGLLGDKMIDISPGTPRSAVLAPGDTVQAMESLDYDQVIAQASSAVGDMVQLTSDLKTITGGIVRGDGTMGQLVTNRALYDELTTTLTRANSLIAQVQNPNGAFGRLLSDPQLYDRLTSTVASMDSLLLAINSDKGTVGRLLRDDSLYVSLVHMSRGADSLLTQLSSGNGFAGRMLRDQQLYDQLNKLVTDVNAVLEDVRKNPRKYTKGMIKVF
ncbi:MAG TPA: MlaD family protein [Gemmatimonadaceae bacterium]|nr:MlaD family protein [Gemmatimonadaceae bacterium]